MMSLENLGSNGMNMMSADAIEKRPSSKYDRLIAAAKAVPALSTVVLHPCD
jgi:phosphate acetyltransferase